MELLIKDLLCLDGAMDKAGPEKYIWHKSKPFTTEDLSHRLAFCEPMAFILNPALFPPYLSSLVPW